MHFYVIDDLTPRLGRGFFYALLDKGINTVYTVYIVHVQYTRQGGAYAVVFIQYRRRTAV